MSQAPERDRNARVTRSSSEFDQATALQSLEAALERAVPPESAWPSAIHSAMRYSLFAGGKRIRPLLVLAAGHAAGGSESDVLRFACAVELIHTYSLVHDDLPAMDDDDLRRGRPTCHKKYGEALAILAGDALLTRAFEWLTVGRPSENGTQRERRWKATALLASAAGTSGLIGGQAQDLESEGQEADPEILERIHAAKTGALLRASVCGGGLLGGADDAQIALLSQYAESIGLAFQIVDDVLDATGSSSQLGKTPGKDAATGKTTYVSVYGLDEARRQARALLDESLRVLRP
ncbi:MAG TPA: farnesyl diphosphate synthase, partial [Candidatus Krumholzibacteria bacterium]